MDVQYERDEGGLTTLTIQVPVETVDEIYQKALREFKRHVTVPGFRRGKVPPKLIESIIGPEHIVEHARELLTDQVLPEAMKQVPELVPMDEAEIELGEFRRGEACDLTAKMVCAKVELADYKGVPVELWRADVTAEEALEELELQYRRDAVRRPAEHDQVEPGDEVEFTLRIVRDGVLIEDYGEDDPLRVKIGDNPLNPSLDEHLLGCRIGEHKVAVVTYPDDFDNEELRGQSAEFAFGVLGIVEPEAWPAYIERITGCDDVDEGLERVRSALEERRRYSYRMIARERAIEAVVRASQVDVPTSHVEADVMEELDEYEEELESRGVDLDAVEDQVQAEEERIRERVTYDLHRTAVLRAIGVAEELELEQEDLVQELGMMSSANRVDPRLLMRRLEEQGMMPRVVGQARMRKVGDLLLEWAEVTEVDPPDDDEEADEVDELRPSTVEAVIGEEDELDTTPVALDESEDEPCP